DVAARGQYPAVNILSSVSRLERKALNAEQLKVASRVRAMIAEYENTRELRLLGAYKAGVNRELDMVVERVPRIYEFLIQAPEAVSNGDPFREIASVLAT
ncbi:MAG: flagellum-specific ATP synthase FliI, partial [Proteobacteria bacterium]|nr:flagellum-specific ATP synthase FliI [Pseudomonadota bacterium]